MIKWEFDFKLTKHSMTFVSIVMYGLQLFIFSIYVVSTLDGLAVDYINRLLFITDTGLNQISVLSLSQSKYNKVIISEKLDQPRAIVVHPMKGYAL